MDVRELLSQADQLHRAGQMAQAEEAYRKVLAVDGGQTEAWFKLGVLALQRGQAAEAVEHLERAIGTGSDKPAYYLNLGVALHSLGRIHDAAVAYARAIALRPDYAAAFNNLAQAACEQGDVRQALVCHDRSAELNPGDPVAASNRLLALHYHPDFDAKALFREHQAWDERFGRAEEKPFGSRNRPLRVGYVSADFRRHSVGYFFAPLLANHDRSVVEAYCYSGVRRADEMTAKLRGAARGWREIARLNDEAFVEMVRADGIDILVDLAGHTAGNRLPAFALWAAPVQVTYLGYPNTTGLSAMDFRLTDALADPPGMTEALNTEELVRLPTCAWCFEPWPDAPAPRAETRVR